MSKKEKLEGINLQVSAIFVRLDSLKKSLPEGCLDKYNELMNLAKQEFRDKYDVNETQLDEWFQ